MMMMIRNRIAERLSSVQCEQNISRLAAGGYFAQPFGPFCLITFDWTGCVNWLIGLERSGISYDGSDWIDRRPTEYV